MTTNRAIYLLRRARHLTRQQLAERSGVNREVIWAIETGKTRAPQLRVIERLAAAMEVGVGRLIDERRTMLTTLEEPLIRSLTQPVNLVRVLNQQQRSHVLQTLRRIGGPSWAR